MVLALQCRKWEDDLKTKCGTYFGKDELRIAFDVQIRLGIL